MPINDSYDEQAVIGAIAGALDRFYTSLIEKVDSLNIKKVMRRKNPYIFVKGRKNGFLGKFPVFFVLCCKFVKHMLNLPLTGEGESNIQKVYFFVPRFTKGNALDREVEA